jgi:hypothetical protein
VTQTDTPGPALPDVYGPSGAGIIGDPHITTFDGHRYTLLSQGTVSQWRFSGVEIDFYSEEIGGTKRLPVDWQVYAHSGRQSFTKGRRLTCFSTCQEDLCGT